MSNVAAIQHVNILQHLITSSANFPDTNNALVPVLIYQKTLHLESKSGLQAVKVFKKTGGIMPEKTDFMITIIISIHESWV